MSTSAERPVLTTFLTLTPATKAPSKASSSRPTSRRSLSPPGREHRGSSGSDSSSSSSDMENGFLVLTSTSPADRMGYRDGRLMNIEEEAVE